jgi:hypothetical protein
MEDAESEETQEHVLMHEAALAENTGISVSLVARWTTTRSRLSASPVHALM